MFDNDLHSKPTAGGLDQRTESENAFFCCCWYCYLDSWHWRSTVEPDCQRQQEKGKRCFKCSQTWGLENALILLLVSHCLAAACPHLTRFCLAHTDTWFFLGWGLCSCSILRLPDHALRPLGVTFLKQFSSAQAQVRELADFCRGEAQGVLFAVSWLKQHKAAFPLQTTQVSVFKFPLNNSRDNHLLQQFVWSHHTLRPASYKGLLEYCWMSCLWQGLQTRSGLILDGRGSSFAEQASQKIPPQFLQIFWRKSTEKLQDTKDTGQKNKLEFSLYNLQLTQILYWTRERCPLWRPETCPCAQDQATVELIMSKSRWRLVVKVGRSYQKWSIQVFIASVRLQLEHFVTSDAHLFYSHINILDRPVTTLKAP